VEARRPARLGGTYDAEYLALTQLQADAFVTLDKELARRAKEVVPLATIAAIKKT
jgi:predicted nucleic acid-binding protein